MPVTDLIPGNDIFLLLVWHLGDMVPTLKVNDTIGFGATAVLHQFPCRLARLGI